ncbi:glycosyltransferase family 2 protein [Aquibacillus kalidii]|uniref:glycosyltransferase family 2 protein n=1 Tax=Aquibacillus kalidii TaxID=2762597 RepID=UPI001646FE4D|nr:glycosyltransferase [Aquibacillus kalidii]
MISIIIPVFNAEKYLDECIRSIINQDFSEFEIILVNDGSKDRSPQICDFYSGKYENINVLHQDNCGVSSARQNGVNISTGDWVLFLDSDDIVSDNMFELIKTSLCDADVVMFSKEFRETTFYHGPKSELVKAILGYETTEILSRNSMFSVCSKVYRKRFLLEKSVAFEIKLFNGEDMLFNINVILKTNKIKLVNKSFYYYRENSNSITHTYNDKITYNDKLFLDKLDRYIRSHFSEKEFSDIYFETVLNGLFLCIRRFFSHKDNKKSLFVKKKNFKKFISQRPYCIAIDELKININTLVNPQKTLLLLLKFRLTVPVLIICGYQKKVKAKGSVMMNLL